MLSEGRAQASPERRPGTRGSPRRSLDGLRGAEVDLVGDVARVAPAGAGGVGVGYDAAAAVLPDELLERVGAELGRPRRAADVDLAARIAERGAAVVLAARQFERPAVLVHEAVMVAAQEDGVPEARLAPIRPVDDVVPVGEPEPAGTARRRRVVREPAPPVPHLERAAERAGHGSPAAPHVQDPPVGRARDAHDPAVAGDAPGRFS